MHIIRQIFPEFSTPIYNDVPSTSTSENNGSTIHETFDKNVVGEADDDDDDELGASALLDTTLTRLHVKKNRWHPSF